MNGTPISLSGDAPSGEDLMAYLDGELDADTRRQLEARLSQDAALRQRLKEYQQTWDLLDEIPRASVGDEFTRTTVEMVAIKAEEEVSATVRVTSGRRKWLMAGGIAGALAALAGGYWFTYDQLSAGNRRLLRDLHIIENLDAYQNTPSLDFLRELDREKLFREESSDEP